MDEIQMVRTVYPEPAPPTAREIAKARALLSESPRRSRRRLGRGSGALVAGAAAAAVAAALLVAVRHSPAAPAPAGAAPVGPAARPATRAGTGAPPTLQELAYRASTAALTGQAVAPGQWVYMKQTQTLRSPKRTRNVTSEYLQSSWNNGYLTATTESWQTADALKITEADYLNNVLRVESNPTLGKDISYAELVRFRGSPRALANYIYYRETQIQGPESASQTWFETYYEMAGLFRWFVLPPRVDAEIFQALPYVPGVSVEKVAGGIAFSSAGIARLDTGQGMAVRIILDPATYKTSSVYISSGKFSNNINMLDIVPVSGPGVRP